MNAMLDPICRVFRYRFGACPTVGARAPGRVELLGNHTDYNGGYVLPTAVDRQTVLVGRANGTGRVRLWTENLTDAAEFALDDIRPDPDHAWADYVKGVVQQWQRAGGVVQGFDAAMVGNVPVGAGLSSSASLEVGTAVLLGGLWPLDIDRMELAKLCRRAENEFVGVQCGILDPFSSLFARRDAAMFLDCKTLAHAVVSLGDPAPALVIVNSLTRRDLVSSQYNTRRAECDAALAYFRGALGRPLDVLRDVTLDEFAAHRARLEPAPAKRAQHILEENQRVLEGCAALRRGEVGLLGRLMSASHASSRDLFENSSTELDALVAMAGQQKGFIGGKLSGAGWAGCTVNLVEADHAEAFVDAVCAAYHERFGTGAEAYVCHSAPGAAGVDVG